MHAQIYKYAQELIEWEEKLRYMLVLTTSTPTSQLLHQVKLARKVMSGKV